MKSTTAWLMMLAATLAGLRVWGDEPKPIPLWKADELFPRANPPSSEKTTVGAQGRWVTGVTEPTIAIVPAGDSTPNDGARACGCVSDEASKRPLTLTSRAATGRGDKCQCDGTCDCPASPHPKPSPAVVICPGGGYNGVALDWEGYDIARWLSGIGITGIVLKYRMPQPDISLDITRDDKPLPLVDAQRALRMVRANAAQWHIDPTKVGIAGFSAGGHLASMAGTHFDKPDPQASGPLQRESDRPDFMILVYPITSLTDPLGHDARLKLLGTTPDEKMVYLYSNEKHVTENTPPTFLAHAEDDVVKCEHSTYFFEALRAHKVPCELMLFARGGHGFGLGQKGGEPAAWPKECEAWLMKQHVLTGTPTSAPASSKHQ